MGQELLVNNAIDLGDVSGAIALDGGASNYYRFRLTGNVVATVSNVKAGHSMAVRSDQDGVGAWMIMWVGQTMGAPGSVAPNPAAGSSTTFLLKGSDLDGSTVEMISNSSAAVAPPPANLVPEIVFKPGVPSSGNVFATWAEIQTAMGLLVAAGLGFVCMIDGSVAPTTVPGASGVTNTGGLCRFMGLPEEAVPPVFLIQDGAVLNCGKSAIFSNMQIQAEAITTSPIVLDQTGAPYPIFALDGGTFFSLLPGATVPAVALGAGPAVLSTQRSSAISAPPGVPFVTMNGASTLIYAMTLNSSGNPPANDMIMGGPGDTLVFIRDSSWSLPTFTNFTGALTVNRQDQLANAEPSAGATGAQPTDQAVGQTFYNTTTKNVEISVTGTTTESIYGSGEGELAPATTGAGAFAIDFSVNNIREITLTAALTTLPTFSGVTEGKVCVLVVNQPAVPGGLTFNSAGQVVLPATPASTLSVNPSGLTKTTYVFIGARDVAVPATINLQLVAALGNTPADVDLLVPQIVFRPGTATNGNVYATWAEIQTAVAAFVAGNYPFSLYIDASVAPATVPGGSGTTTFGGLCASLTALDRVSTILTVADGAVLDFGKSFLMEYVDLQCEATTTTPVVVDTTAAVAFIYLQNRAKLTLKAGALVPLIGWATVNALSLFVESNALLNNAAAPAVAIVALAGGATLGYRIFGSTGGGSPQNNTVTGGVTETLNFSYDDSDINLPTFAGFAGLLSNNRNDREDNLLPSTGTTGSQSLNQFVGQKYFNTTTKNLEISVTGTTTESIYGSGEGELAPVTVGAGAFAIDFSVNNVREITLTAALTTLPTFSGVTEGKVCTLIVNQPATPGALTFNSAGQVVLPAGATSLAVNPNGSTKTTYVFIGARDVAVPATINLQLMASSGNLTGLVPEIVFRPGGVSSGNVFATWAEVKIAIGVFVANFYPFTLAIDTGLAAAEVPGASGTTNLAGIATLRFSSETLGAAPTLTVKDGATLAFGPNIAIDGLSIACESVTAAPITVTGTTPNILLTSFAQIALLAGALLPAISVAGAVSFQLNTRFGALIDHSAVPLVPVVALSAGATMTYGLTNNTSGITPQNDSVTGGLGTTLIVKRDASYALPTFVGFTGAFAASRSDRLANAQPSSGATGAQPVDQAVGQTFYNTTTKNVEVSVTGTTTESIYGSGEGDPNIGVVGAGAVALDASVSNSFTLQLTASLTALPSFTGVTEGKVIGLRIVQPAGTTGGVTFNGAGGQTVLPTTATSLDINTGSSTTTSFLFQGVRNIAVPATIDLQLMSRSGVDATGGSGVSLGVVEGIYSGMAQQ